MEAYRQLNSCHDQVVADVRDMISELLNTDILDAQIADRQQEINEISTLVRAEIQSNATHANMQDSFDERFERLQKRYNTASAALADLQQQKAERSNRLNRITTFLQELEGSQTSALWDDRLCQLLEKACVFADSSIEFSFYNGTTIRVPGNSHSSREGSSSPGISPPEESVTKRSRSQKQPCSPECCTDCQQTEKKKKPRSQRSFIHHTCETCGQSFAAPRAAKRRYCSHACYIKARFGSASQPEDHP